MNALKFLQLPTATQILYFTQQGTINLKPSATCSFDFDQRSNFALSGSCTLEQKLLPEHNNQILFVLTNFKTQLSKWIIHLGYFCLLSGSA